jgi:hypothetical protein
MKQVADMPPLQQMAWSEYSYIRGLSQFGTSGSATI